MQDFFADDPNFHMHPTLAEAIFQRSSGRSNDISFGAVSTYPEKKLSLESFLIYMFQITLTKSESTL